MKRGEPPKRRTPIKRSAPPARSKPLSRGVGPKRATLRAKAGKPLTQPGTSPREAFVDLFPTCRVCGAEKGPPHHVVYAQHVRRAGGDVWAPENAFSVCFGCHGDHHLGAARIPLAKLRDENIGWAFVLLGPRAFDYLRRRYSGEDPRVEAVMRFLLRDPSER